MGNSIIRGQPWSIRLRLKPEQIVVGNIQGIYLAVVQGANKTVKIFADGVSNWTLNSSQNTVTCQLSAANTNTLTAGIRAGISAHITDTSGEKSEVFAGIYAVENQGSTDVLPDILDANIQSGQTIPDSEIDADLRPATFTNNGTYSPSGFDGYSQVTVNVGAPSGTKRISITENGTITENVANYANAAITTNVVNQDYLASLTALGVTEDLADSIGALTTYANGVTGESDTTLSDAVASLADGYGQGGGISDGIEILGRDSTGFATKARLHGNGPIYGYQFACGNANGRNNIGPWQKIEDIEVAYKPTSIKTLAFVGLNTLTSFLCDMSEVQSIEGNAFRCATGIGALSFPNVTSLSGSGIFQESSITSASFPLFNGQIPNSTFRSCTSLASVSFPRATKLGTATSTLFKDCTALVTASFGSVGYNINDIRPDAFSGCTQSGLTITVYTKGTHVDGLLTNIRNGATNATIIFKASETTTYNGTSYSAGDTILTSTPTS